MNFTRTTNLKIIRWIGLALVIIIVVVYAIARSFNYARGPHIIITEPLDGSSISSRTVTISGLVERAHDLILNGDAITIDEQGHFKEIRIIFPGLNYMDLIAKDQFGRTTETTLTLVGRQK